MYYCGGCMVWLSDDDVRKVYEHDHTEAWGMVEYRKILSEVICAYCDEAVTEMDRDVDREEME